MSLENFQSLPEAQQEKILDGPALSAPPGVTPNLDDPTQYNNGAHALLAICLTLTVLALSIRAYSRIFHSKSLQVADCTFLLYSGLIRFYKFVFANNVQIWLSLDS